MGGHLAVMLHDYAPNRADAFYEACLSHVVRAENAGGLEYLARAGLRHVAREDFRPHVRLH